MGKEFDAKTLRGIRQAILKELNLGGRLDESALFEADIKKAFAQAISLQAQQAEFKKTLATVRALAQKWSDEQIELERGEDKNEYWASTAAGMLAGHSFALLMALSPTKKRTNNGSNG